MLSAMITPERHGTIGSLDVLDFQVRGDRALPLGGGGKPCKGQPSRQVGTNQQRQERERDEHYGGLNEIFWGWLMAGAGLVPLSLQSPGFAPIRVSLTDLSYNFICPNNDYDCS